MRKFLIILLCSQLFTASNGFAQMGHGMMREYGGGEGMMEHMMAQDGMMSHEQTADTIADIMRQLSELMLDLSGKIEDSPSEKLHDLRDIMKDMSDEMNYISRIVEKDTTTVEEVKTMHERIARIRQKVLATVRNEEGR